MNLLNQIDQKLSTLSWNLLERTHLDFSGISNLTDESFYVLKEKLTDHQKLSVVSISLEACYYISDRGIQLLSQQFPNLESINLSYCRFITQRSIEHLTKCNKLLYINCDCTDVSFISAKVCSKIRISAKRCPIICVEDPPSQQANISSVVTLETSINLVILVSNPGINLNVTKLIMDEKKVYQDFTQQPIIYTPNALQSENGVTINIVEMHTQSIYFTPFLAERSVFIIVTDTEQMNPNPSFSIICNLDYIRGVVPQAPIILLNLYKSSGISSVSEVDRILSSIFTDQKNNIKEHLIKEDYKKFVK
ncbi:hypothetical protein Ciccas_007852 [Cichlidogyrus casuarinus]|uniref:Uncharacterized protein n=1 Tax=Cichlidogyrus casuarinus TaxID=1844966 RepID=A0ABD2Q1Q1_9PLAT